MADNAPRARIGAFSGGPLGIGWAPWAIGAAALVAGVYLFMRRGGGSAAAQQTAASGALPISQPYPYPTGTVPANPSSVSSQQLQALWRFGGGADPQKSVWRATPTGVQNFQTATGGAWPGGVYPNLPDPSTSQALGGFGWQWAAVPQGYDPSSFAQALNNPSAQQMAGASQGQVNFAA